MGVSLILKYWLEVISVVLGWTEIDHPPKREGLFRATCMYDCRLKIPIYS